MMYHVEKENKCSSTSKVLLLPIEVLPELRTENFDAASIHSI